MPASSEVQIALPAKIALHARPAGQFVKTASQFQAQVRISVDGKAVDAKSILGILLMAAAQGSQLTIRCDGQDEEEAMRAVTGLIGNRFDEES